MAFSTYLSYVYWGNTVEQYLIALGIFLGVMLLLKVFKQVFLAWATNFSRRTSTDIDDLIINILRVMDFFFYIVLAAWIATRFLILSDVFHKVERYFLVVVGMFYLVRMLAKLVHYGESRIVKKKKDADDSIIRVMGAIVIVLLWIIAFLFVLSSFGVNITALVAGLGIGGIAIALALQNVLSDLFSSFSIYLDKPFKKGDFIVVGSDMGTVKKIGVKSTRIETLQGQELIISNREMTSARVNNFKKMQKRRVQFNIGVVYSTSGEKIRWIVDKIKEIIRGIDKIALDRVHFARFGDYSLVFEIVYYVDTDDYNLYMDIQQEINFRIKESLESNGIGMSLPTQRLFLEEKEPNPKDHTP